MTTDHQAQDDEAAIDDALGLVAVSIRLPKGLIETYKLLAQAHGTRYQLLMRDALMKAAEAEMKRLLTLLVIEQSKEIKT